MNLEEIRKQFETWKNTQGYMGSVDRDERAEIAWDAWQAALASKQDIKQGLDDIQLSMSMFANKEDYLKAVKEQEHIESNQDLTQSKGE